MTDQPQPDSQLFTCLSCSIAFLSPEDQSSLPYIFINRLIANYLFFLASRSALPFGPPQVQYEASGSWTVTHQRRCLQSEGSGEEN